MSISWHRLLQKQTLAYPTQDCLQCLLFVWDSAFKLMGASIMHSFLPSKCKEHGKEDSAHTFSLHFALREANPFDEIFERHTVSFVTLIQGHSQCFRFCNAFRLFSKLHEERHEDQSEGIKKNNSSFGPLGLSSPFNKNDSTCKPLTKPDVLAFLSLSDFLSSQLGFRSALPNGTILTLLFANHFHIDAVE
ncbi:unnamed protein product [Dovyalis caffra]|uniref:Uncharacterized protein n=1 Tax=Dovyalis caffra TaxID=77055 RepID=A0AAV1SAS9_9ROSI|nr:unnamed protein product [Dovyalis caffra]